MQINFNSNMQTNPFLNAARINQSFQSRDPQNSSAPLGNNSKRQDTMQLSSKGKVNSLLETLLKQKQQILENKNKMVDSTLSNGGTMESLKVKLEAFDEQLKNIDAQIIQAIAEQTTEQAQKTFNLAENEADSKTASKEEPKTPQEAQQAKIASLQNLTGDLNKIETLNATKTKVEGEARVLASEIKLDIKTTHSTTEGKLKKLAQLNQKSNDLSKSIGEDLSKLNQEVKAENQTAATTQDSTAPEVSQTPDNENTASSANTSPQANPENPTKLEPEILAN